MQKQANRVCNILSYQQMLLHLTASVRIKGTRNRVKVKEEHIQREEYNHDLVLFISMTAMKISLGTFVVPCTKSFRVQIYKFEAFVIFL